MKTGALPTTSTTRAIRTCGALLSAASRRLRVTLLSLIRVDGFDRVIARRKIRAGEELTFDYVMIDLPQ